MTLNFLGKNKYLSKQIKQLIKLIILTSMIVNLVAAAVTGVFYIPYCILKPAGDAIKAYLVKNCDTI